MSREKESREQMLLELCLCMTLHDERGRSNQMLLELCFRMKLHEEMGEGILII